MANTQTASKWHFPNHSCNEHGAGRKEQGWANMRVQLYGGGTHSTCIESVAGYPETADYGPSVDAIGGEGTGVQNQIFETFCVFVMLSFLRSRYVYSAR